MDSQDNYPYTPLVFKYFLLLFAFSILLLVRLFWPFLPILVLSYLLTGIFRPAYHLLRRRLSSVPASLLTCLLVVLVVFLPLVFFVVTLSHEAFALYQAGKGVNLGLRLRELIEGNAIVHDTRAVLADFGIVIEPDSFSQWLSGLAKVAGMLLYDHASAWAANIMGFVVKFFIMIIVIFFLLIDHERLVDFMLRLSPLPEEQKRSLIRKFDDIAWAVLIGNGVSGLIQGTLGGIAFAIFGLGSPVLWAGIMGVLAFLPIFGIGLVLVPAAFLLLAKGKIASCVVLLLFYMVVTFSIEHIVKPKMVSEGAKMHTLLALLSIIGGLSVFGIMGIVYGPLIVTAFLSLAEIYLGTYDEHVRVSNGGTPPAPADWR
ncbi:MAG: AI-2E family transporter [Desulfobacteraceae bacterium]|nr:AI-2E family transporter [Desulfobacteraceae bacterium]